MQREKALLTAMQQGEMCWPLPTSTEVERGGGRGCSRAGRWRAGLWAGRQVAGLGVGSTVMLVHSMLKLVSFTVSCETCKKIHILLPFIMRCLLHNAIISIPENLL